MTTIDTCRRCGVVLTEDNWSEAAWIEWLEHACQPCIDALVTTVTCAGCDTEMTGIPRMDWHVFERRDEPDVVDHVCEDCVQQANAQQAQDMAAQAPQL